LARSYLIGCHRFRPRPQLQSRRLPPSDAADRVLQSLSPIEFDACQSSIRPSPVEQLRKHLHLSIEVSRSARLGYSIASLHSSLQQIPLSFPLFTSGEGGPPAAPGPPASRWQNEGSQQSFARFPRYPMAKSRGITFTRCVAAHPVSAYLRSFGISWQSESLAAECKHPQGPSP